MCHKTVHLICGDADDPEEEGYGQKVTCFNCSNSTLNLSKKIEVRTEQSSGKNLWGFLKRLGSKLEEIPPEKKKASEASVCLKCGKTLTRNTESHKQRHLEQAHKELVGKKNLTIFVPPDHESAKKILREKEGKTVTPPPTPKIVEKRETLPTTVRSNDNGTGLQQQNKNDTGRPMDTKRVNESATSAAIGMFYPQFYF